MHGRNPPGPRAGGLQLGGDVEEVVLTQAAGGELDPDGETGVVDAEGQGDGGLAGPVEQLGEAHEREQREHGQPDRGGVVQA